MIARIQLAPLGFSLDEASTHIPHPRSLSLSLSLSLYLYLSRSRSLSLSMSLYISFSLFSFPLYLSFPGLTKHNLRSIRPPMCSLLLLLAAAAAAALLLLKPRRATNERCPTRCLHENHVTLSFISLLLDYHVGAFGVRRLSDVIACLIEHRFSFESYVWWWMTSLLPQV